MPKLTDQEKKKARQFSKQLGGKALRKDMNKSLREFRDTSREKGESKPGEERSKLPLAQQVPTEAARAAPRTAPLAQGIPQKNLPQWEGRAKKHILATMADRLKGEVKQQRADQAEAHYMAGRIGRGK